MRKTRAALVGTNAFPFLMFYWVKLFRTYWQDEVDRVYMVVSTPSYLSVYPYIKKVLQIHPKIVVVTTNKKWPDSINSVAPTIPEDLLLILHDDTLIFQKGLVDYYFSIVEQTGKVATPIYPIYTNPTIIEELMLLRWPNQLPMKVFAGTDEGFSFYAFLLFVSKALFQKTRMDFGNWEVKMGERSDELNFTPRRYPLAADTNFKLGLDLLSAGAEFVGIPKYRFQHLYNEPDPMTAFRAMVNNKTDIFTKHVGWIHLQTIAYHINSLFYDLGYSEAISQLQGGPVRRKIEIEGNSKDNLPWKWSMTFKIALVYEFMTGLSDYGAIDRFYQHAKSELEFVIDYLDISRDDVEEIQKSFHALLFPSSIV